jgi:hypothetical protein
MPAGAHSIHQAFHHQMTGKPPVYTAGTLARGLVEALSRLKRSDIGLVQLGESGVVGNVVFWHLKGFLKYRLPWRARELADLDVLEFFV